MGFEKGRQPPRLPGERFEEPTRESPEFSDRYVGRNPGEHEIESKIGVWYDAFSTMIVRVRFDWHSPWTGAAAGPPPLPDADPERRKGYLSVEMMSLAVIGYREVEYREFDEFINSSSKGTWLRNSRLWTSDYDEVRGPQRKVTAEMRRQREAQLGRLTYSGHPKPPKYSRPGRVRG